MERVRSVNKPKLKTRGFSTLHIELFEQVLYSGKTNWDLNLEYGYTKRSHALVDHTRKVMYKLLVLEELKRTTYRKQVVSPRVYGWWWKELLHKHKKALLAQAIKPEYYDLEIGVTTQAVPELQSGTWNSCLI